MGNPNYTAASVAANGARWPVHLTITYNASILQTYCLAQVGAVIDNNTTPHGSDLIHQISNGFLPNYGNSNSGKWSPGSSLFITFFGVNDVNLVLPYTNSSAYLDRIFTSYGNSIEQVSRSLPIGFVIKLLTSSTFKALQSRRSQFSTYERAANGPCSESTTRSQATHIRCEYFSVFS